MKNFNFLENLNKLLKSFCEENAIKNVNLRAGEIEETLLLSLKEKAPFSKIAVLFTEKSAKSLLKHYQTLLKKEGYNVHSVVIKEKALYSVSDLLDASVLPENVRAVVTFDHSLLTPLKYSSTINDVPAIFINVANQTEGLLDCSDYIKNGALASEFNFDSEFTVIFNNQLEGEIGLKDIIFGYALVLDIIDYETAKTVKGETPSDTVISLITEGSILSDTSALFEKAVNYQVSNFLSFGELKRKSAFNLAVKSSVLANGKILTLEEKARLIKALYVIYKFGLESRKSEILEITDYLGMMTKACKRMKLDVFLESENFLKFLDDIAKNSDALEKRFERFTKVFNIDGLLKDLGETFNLFSDMPKKDLKTCILDGVCINPYNLLGVLTSKGVLNKIL